MKTNLLLVTRIPSIIHYCDTNLTYPEVNQLLKTKAVYYHLYRNKLYFIGDSEVIKRIFGSEGVDVEITTLNLNDDILNENWHILRVVLYKSIRHFLFRKGFEFHRKYRDRAYIVEKRRYNPVTLVYNYSDQGKPAFVHEGFTFFFKLYDSKIYLGMNPCIVITSDGTNIIHPTDLSHDKYPEYKKWFIDKRYNSKIREMVNTFVDMLSNEMNKIIIPVFDDQLEIDNKFVEID